MSSVASEKHISLSTAYKGSFIGNICHYIKWTASLSPSFITAFSLSLPLVTSSLGQVPKMLARQYHLSYQLKLSNWLPPLPFQRALQLKFLLF